MFKKWGTNSKSEPQSHKDFFNEQMNREFTITFDVIPNPWRKESCG